MGILDSITNKFYNSDVGRVFLDDNSYASTPYNSNFIPEYLTTTGQKRFSTNSAIPNLPKLETMFFVYFSLNPEAQAMINKKKALINFLVNANSSDTSTSDVQSQNLASRIQSGMTSLINGAADYINSGLNSIAKSFTGKDLTSQENKNQKIPNTENSKTFGDYIPDKFLLNQLSFELSKFVKTIDKPSIDFDIKEYNEYNRKRLVYEKINYGPVKITFYDVKENPVQQFFFAYLKMINNNFLCKDYTHYNKKIVTNKFDTDITDWGFSTDSNFRLIDKISICEFYMDKMMVYTLENPVIKSINFGTNKMGSFNANEINITFQYEGFTNDLLDIEPYNTQFDTDKTKLKSMINSNIDANMANFLNMRYKDGASMGIDTAVSFIKGVLDAPSDERWDKIKSQTLDTLRKLGFSDEINLTNSLLEDIENYKNSEDKAKYLLKLTDDPSSILGQVLNNGSTSSAEGFLKMFF